MSHRTRILSPEQESMLYQASHIILHSILTGIAATLTMDLLTGFARRSGIAAGAKGAWIGRWYLGMAEGLFLHRDIVSSKERRGEKGAAMAGHYVIGIVLAVAYVHGAVWLGLSPGAFLPSVGFGTATVVLPLFLVYPALGFGCCGRIAPELKPLQTSLLNHVFYGLGLWWSCNALTLP